MRYHLQTFVQRYQSAKKLTGALTERLCKHVSCCHICRYTDTVRSQIRENVVSLKDSLFRALRLKETEVQRRRRHTKDARVGAGVHTAQYSDPMPSVPAKWLDKVLAATFMYA